MRSPASRFPTSSSRTSCPGWRFSRGSSGRPPGPPIRRRARLLLLAVLLALDMLAGDVFSTATAIACGSLWILCEREPGTRPRELALFGGAVLLAMLAAAPQIVAAALWIPETGRAVVGMKLQESLFYSISPFRLLEFIVPYPFGPTFALEPREVFAHAIFRQKAEGLFATLYAGAFALIGAAGSPAEARRRSPVRTCPRAGGPGRLRDPEPSARAVGKDRLPARAAQSREVRRRSRAGARGSGRALPSTTSAGCRRARGVCSWPARGCVSSPRPPGSGPLASARSPCRRSGTLPARRGWRGRSSPSASRKAASSGWRRCSRWRRCASCRGRERPPAWRSSRSCRSRPTGGSRGSSPRMRSSRGLLSRCTWIGWIRAGNTGRWGPGVIVLFPNSSRLHSSNDPGTARVLPAELDPVHARPLEARDGLQRRLRFGRPLAAAEPAPPLPVRGRFPGRPAVLRRARAALGDPLPGSGAAAGLPSGARRRDDELGRARERRIRTSGSSRAGGRRREPSRP